VSSGVFNLKKKKSAIILRDFYCYNSGRFLQYAFLSEIVLQYAICFSFIQLISWKDCCLYIYPTLFQAELCPVHLSNFFPGRTVSCTFIQLVLGRTVSCTFIQLFSIQNCVLYIYPTLFEAELWLVHLSNSFRGRTVSYTFIQLFSR